MKLAISNIAWQRHDDPRVLALLRTHGVSGIEVAPTKVWPGLDGATTADAERYRRTMADAGFALPALQAIFFGRPELRLFDAGAAKALRAHLGRIADLAAALGAGVLVWGAPRGRRRGQLGTQAAHDRAVEAMAPLAEVCAARGVCIGIEPNPPEYGCDFLTNVADARRLVDDVGHAGLQLHLDAAAMHMGGGSIAEVIAGAGHFAHYHVSEPALAPIGGARDDGVDHGAAFAALRRSGYESWVSVEMRQPAADGLAVLGRSLEAVKEAMGPAATDPGAREPS